MEKEKILELVIYKNQAQKSLVRVNLNQLIKYFL
jgi:hypothetical protein